MSSCRRCIPAFSHTNMNMTEVLWALPCSQLHASYQSGDTGTTEEVRRTQLEPVQEAGLGPRGSMAACMPSGMHIICCAVLAVIAGPVYPLAYPLMQHTIPYGAAAALLR